MQDTVIHTEKLTKRFGDFIAANELTFDVKKGEIFGFLGANGAGKTTAMRMLCGLSIPSSGKATVAGFDVFRQTEEIKKNIGYMSQKFSLYENLTVSENIRFYAGIYGLSQQQIKDKTAELLDRLGLRNEAKKLVSELPLGWKQKLAFSVAIAHQPKIVFLDEPTGGVDPVTRRQFWDLIRSLRDEGTSILLTTHYLDEAQQLSDRAGIIAGGRLVALGAIDELGGLDARVPIVRWVEGGRVREERTQEPGALVARLMADGEPDRLEVIRPSLEDIYLDLVGEAAVATEPEGSLA